MVVYIIFLFLFLFQFCLWSCLWFISLDSFYFKPTDWVNFFLLLLLLFVSYLNDRLTSESQVQTFPLFPYDSGFRLLFLSSLCHPESLYEYLLNPSSRYFQYPLDKFHCYPSVPSSYFRVFGYFVIPFDSMLLRFFL